MLQTLFLKLVQDLLGTALSKRVLLAAATVVAVLVLNATVPPIVIGVIGGVAITLIWGDSIRPLTSKLEGWLK